MWDYCGMSRDRTGLEKALSEIPGLYQEFKSDVRVLGTSQQLNQSLEKAGRVDDFFQLAELMCRDALHREESCGAHFREEHQFEDGEAKRDDENFAYVAAWEWTGAEPGPEQGTAGVRRGPTDHQVVQVTASSRKNGTTRSRNVRP